MALPAARGAIRQEYFDYFNRLMVAYFSYATLLANLAIPIPPSKIQPLSKFMREAAAERTLSAAPARIIDS